MKMFYSFVDRAAKAADGVAAGIPGRSSGAWSGTAAAVHGSGNLTAAPALERCRTAWSQQLASAQDNLTDLAAEMRKDMAAYRAKDAAVGASYELPTNP